MEPDNRTEEQIRDSIAIHWDSWDICEALSSKETLTEEEQFNLDRNKDHIQIMLKVDWFVKGCTKDELDKFKKYNK